MLDALLRWLERIGRKSVMVDFFGRVMMERYHLLWYEDDAGKGIWPNIWIHRFPVEESPDSRVATHRHPWNTFSIVLRGGYTQIIKTGNVLREHIHRKLTFLSHKKEHRISELIPHTVTIFCHGWRKQPWTFHHGERVVERGDWYREANTEWLRVGPHTERKLAIRRRALKKLGVATPSSNAEFVALLREKGLRK